MARKRVLLVDDDQDLLLQYDLVVGKKYEVLTANGGAAAIAQVKEGKPDLIVMDVMMDNVTDGLDTARKLKDDGLLGDTPLIMLTGVNDHFDYTTQIAPDYFPKDKWLNKPIKPTDLLCEIDEFIG